MIELTTFFKTKISTTFGLVLIISLAASSVGLIAAANASGAWLDETIPLRVQKTGGLQAGVLSQAVYNSDNNPVCVNDKCFYYHLPKTIVDDTVTGAGVAEKKIVISLDEQRLMYFEGPKIMGDFRISSGLVRTPTPKGEHVVSVKKPIVNYVGAGYNYSNTKWNLLFKPNPRGNYYIHGAYWHNNFGRPMSHGCINVAYENMEKLYDWADVGTRVIVQDQPIIPFADGTLVLDAVDRKTIYVIESGKKRGFTGPEVFKDLGYEYSQVLKANLSSYPSGVPIGSVNGTHPLGTLVRSGEQIFKITDFGKKLIPNDNVFTSWGWDVNQVVEANAADLKLTDLDNMEYRDGMLIGAADGTILISSDGVFKPLSSLDTDFNKRDTMLPFETRRSN